jgi:hypothetical protein
MRDRIEDGFSEMRSAILPADGMIAAGRPESSARPAGSSVIKF